MYKIISFFDFQKQLILEGGNVQIDDQSADQLNLTQLSRSKLVTLLTNSLAILNKQYSNKTGIPLWGDDLFLSRDFLSGSSFHFFDNNIPDDEFVSKKPKVGDIDLQVDALQKNMIEQFLKSLSKNEKVGELTYIGYKASGDQFITLWHNDEFNINIQIDLELVAFTDGKPSEWSRFSHSSAWEDISIGVKGLFHKYLMRAIQHRSARDVIILPKTARGKEKVLKKSELAFSLKGLRLRMKPVLDKDGEQLVKNGMPCFQEIETNDADFITDLSVIFSSFFGFQGTKEDISKMSTFVSLINLIKQYLPKSDHKIILDAFADILWEKGAQGLVRGNPTADYDTKITALSYLMFQLALGNLDDYADKIANYYKNYK